MNRTILRLSTQALLGRRRGLVLALIPAVVLALAIVVRALTEAGTGYEIIDAVGFTLALPLVALLASSAVLGPEIDDGSIVYLIAKPVPRRVVVLSKFVVAWLATLALGALPLLLAGLVLDSSAPSQAVAWALGGAVAGTTYTALFLGLAALTRHAVVIGLLFVLLWEGLLGGSAQRHPVARHRCLGPGGGRRHQRRREGARDGPRLRAAGRDPGHRGVDLVRRGPPALLRPPRRRVRAATPVRRTRVPRMVPLLRR